MNKISDRIRLLRKQKSFTQRELAALLNCTVQSVSEWERGNTYPYDFLPQLAHTLNVTIDYLVTGVEGSIEAASKLSGLTKEQLTSKSTLLIKQALETPQVNTVSKVTPIEAGREGKILLAGNIAAGGGVNIEDVDAEGFIQCPHGIPERDAFALNVRGESMYPFIQEGDIVFIQKRDIHLPPIEDENILYQVPLDVIEPLNKKVVAVRFEDESILKTLRVVPQSKGAYNLYFDSINPAYPTKTVERSTDCQITGVMTGLLRRTEFPELNKPKRSKNKR